MQIRLVTHKKAPAKYSVDILGTRRNGDQVLIFQLWYDTHHGAKIAYVALKSARNFNPEFDVDAKNEYGGQS